VPEKVACAVSDRQAFTQPDQLRLTGWIGARVEANEANRLVKIDVNRLLEGYRKRPGRQTWDGEHVGKWLHAATLAWVNTGDPALRQRVTEQVVVASAVQDPVGAARIALQQMAPGGEQDRALVSIVLRWVQADPQAAAAWVVQFPEGGLRRDAAEGLVNLWADRDLNASGNWLLTLPAGDLRNAGILAYARTLERTDAELARQWALSVNRDQ
jgi:hypothetical protein